MSQGLPNLDRPSGRSPDTNRPTDAARPAEPGGPSDSGRVKDAVPPTDAGRPVESGPLAVSGRADEPFVVERNWRQKFRHAFRGFKSGVRGESSFFVHFFAAASVLAGAVTLNAELWQWCVLTLCVGAVLAAEMFNTAIERLAKAITRERHPEVGKALDIASAAVLLTAIAAAAVGVMVFAKLLLPLVGL